MLPEAARSADGLEPVTVSLDDEENPELVDMNRRFWVCLFLAIPVFAIGMSDLIPGQPLQHRIGGPALNWVQLVLATPVVLWGGWPFFERAWQSIVNRSLNMFTLIGLGVAVAYVFSVIAVIAPQLFPPSFRGHGGAVPVYFEAAAVITTRVVGPGVELRAAVRLETRSSAARSGAENCAARRCGRPRTRCAVGRGACWRSTSSAARRESAGRWCDSRRFERDRRVDGDGRTDCRGKRFGRSCDWRDRKWSRRFRDASGACRSETLLAQIVQMVAEAQRSRAPIQKLADVVSSYFVPAVIAIAVVAFFVWSIWGPEPRMAYGSSMRLRC